MQDCPEVLEEELSADAGNLSEAFLCPDHRDFGITDDTLFITSYANGKLTVEVLDDSDDENEAM